MKKILSVLSILIIILGIIMIPIIYRNLTLDQTQLRILKVLIIMMLSSAAYCFIVGEISRNNSQMDKLWSIMPIAYSWVIAIMSNMNIRIVIMSIIITLWGIRLTINFGRKGAYSWKFWEGEEDYRWKILRTKKPFNNKIVWGIFDLLFISFYQNLLVLLITIPLLFCVNSTKPINYLDIISIVLSIGFLLIETIADEEQWKFQTTKYKYLNEGLTLEDLEEPYKLGFNTTGLWNRIRHPNYLGEQGIWVSIYIFSIASGLNIYNPSILGCLLLILLFMGSSALAEKISSSKYPLYEDYQNKVFKYIPLKKYK